MPSAPFPPLPHPSQDTLFPPCDDHTYFKHGKDSPFAATAEQFCTNNASWLADAALLAYSEEAQVQPHYRSAGFTDVTRLAGATTQSYVAASEQAIIVSFRGTQVFKRDFSRAMIKRVFADWLTDARFALQQSPEDGSAVHEGFAGALEETRPHLDATLTRLLREQPSRRVWFTGHSLGAALATLAAHRCPHEVQGVYTFGSPRVGDATFKSSYQHRTYRIVHQDDVIARVPVFSVYSRGLPRSLVAYDHVGEFRLIDHQGQLHLNPSRWTQVRGFLDEQLKRALGLTGNLRHGLLWYLLPTACHNHAPLFYAYRLQQHLAQGLEPPHPPHHSPGQG